jgi:hypothetical protein
VSDVATLDGALQVGISRCSLDPLNDAPRPSRRRSVDRRDLVASLHVVPDDLDMPSSPRLVPATLSLFLLAAGCGGSPDESSAPLTSNGAGGASGTGGSSTAGSAGVGGSPAGSGGTSSAGSAGASGGKSDPPFTGLAGTVLFATQVPIGGFGTVTSTFFNHSGSVQSAPRGGDLMIRYPDGSLRNLTAEAGLGDAGEEQGVNAIAVREPSVHWSGNKALFSMVVGAPHEQYEVTEHVWQIYEVSGLGKGEVASVRKIDGQPSGYHNVSPIYGTDDRILFASDRPRGAAHLHPQLDEYESAPIVVGIYSLAEPSGALTLLEHAPSGVFGLSIDSAGRVVFTKWDHLQRDQQGDTPAVADTYHPLTWASEAADATPTASITGAEMFPEARDEADPSYDPALYPHSFNQFFPWQLLEDGTEEETLSHVGRHELGGSYSEGSFFADSNLSYYTPEDLHANRTRIGGSGGLFHLREDPTHEGTFLTTYAPEFGTASGGRILRLTASVNTNADDVVLTPVTPFGDSNGIPAGTGHYRNPLPLSDGTLVASHSPGDEELESAGTTESPSFSYAYRLRVVTGADGAAAPGAYLTAGLHRRVTGWSPDVRTTWEGELWELDPVEVAPRTRPARRTSHHDTPELSIFEAVGVDEAALRQWLRDKELALVVSRNVTQRDRADLQQPFNLRVPGGTESISKEGAVYDVTHLQFFQGDLLRGYGEMGNPEAGRRVLPRPMHGEGVSTAAGGPEGAVPIADDGSIAALVPTRRAMAWQLTGPDPHPAVRERNWISFQPGEIRVCPNCHGVNTASQTGAAAPTNPPKALKTFLETWKTAH